MSNANALTHHDGSPLLLVTAVPAVRQPMAQLLEDTLREEEKDEQVAHDRSFSDGYDAGYVDGYTAAVTDIIAGRGLKHTPRD